MTYRAEIDGLRAVAVLSVIAYHYGALLPGGFIGVDVFFVISGYLITGKIVQALEAGKFTFRGFYIRRAKRILPALFATLIASFITAIILLTPEQMRKFAPSISASVFSLSNFYFKAEAGYFDQASIMKPLLHTWSLSVEEQFYLVYPVTLCLAFRASRRWGMIILIISSGLLSFLLNLSFQDGHSFLVSWSPRLRDWFSNGAVSIFYFTPFRTFEFAVGAVAVWIPPLDREKSRVNELLLLLGLGLIGYSVLTYSDKLLYPSANALIPCFGAALTIYAASARYAGWILRNPIAVRIGLVSYSLYLVHWPLIVFTQIYLFRHLSPQELAISAVASYLLAELMYRFIEQPFRVGRPSLHFAPYSAIGATAMLLVLCLAFMAREQDGWAWRLSDDVIRVATESPQLLPQNLGPIGCKGPCEFGNPNGSKILVVGDSHIDQYTKTLNRMAGDRYHFYLAYSASCYFGATMTARSSPYLQEFCERANAKLHDWLKSTSFEAIILGERWPGYLNALDLNGQLFSTNDLSVLYPSMLKDIAALYEDFRGPIIFVGHAPNSNYPCYLRPKLSKTACPQVSLASNDAFAPAFATFKDKTKLNVTLVNPVETICPNRVCRISDDQGHPLYSDTIHLSVYGAAMIVPQMLAAIQKAIEKRPSIAVRQDVSETRQRVPGVGD